MEERRAAVDQFDPAKVLTYGALFFLTVLIVFICVIISFQIWKTGDANTESWAAFVGIVGWCTGVVSGIYAHRFGTTQQSTAKDAVIQQQARTAAVVAAAVPAATPARAEVVNIDSASTVVNEAAAPTAPGASEPGKS